MSKKRSKLHFVIFGATGDLCEKKTLPALYQLWKQGLYDDIVVLGFARRPWSSQDFRQRLLNTIAYAEPEFLEKMDYIQGSFDQSDAYVQLKNRLLGQEEILFYCATAPQYYQNIAKHLAQQELNSYPLLLEKPFGTSYQSACTLSNELLCYFKEENIFLIDHYLGKQALLHFHEIRQKSPWLEAIWNKQHIKSIELTVYETERIKERGGYYDLTGTIKDMVQNHFIQMLSMLCAELDPSAENFSANKSDLISTLRIKKFHKGQYDAYRHEDRVAPDSQTETFVALELEIDQERWRGIPIMIRTGKALQIRESFIVVEFSSQGSAVPGSRLRISLGPRSGISFSYPLSQLRQEAYFMAPFSFSYQESHGSEPDDAYVLIFRETLGKKRHLLATRAEAESAWLFVDKALEEYRQSPLLSYAVGSLGPEEALNDISQHAQQEWEKLSKK